MLEAAVVLHVWETVEQDLVVGGFVPQGEAHPQLVGLQGLHGDVGVPQAACQGHRRGLGVRRGVHARVCVYVCVHWVQFSQASQLPELTHGVVIFIPGSSQSADPERETIKPLP